MSKKRQPTEKEHPTETEASEDGTTETSECETDKKTAEPQRSPEEIIVGQEAEIAALKDALLRNRAELQNFKRRLNEERIKDRIYANAELIRSLLVPLDNLDIALSSADETSDLKKHLKGLAMIRQEMNDILAAEGLTEIKALNEPFDPNKHQAVAKEKDSGKDPGIVIEVYQKGYQFKERIIRPAMVKVTE